MKNIDLTLLKEASSFRRIAAVAWSEPSDPHIYGSVEIRCEAMEAWVEAKRKETGEKITLTHAVTRALAMVLAKHRDLNSMIRFGSIYVRKDIDIFLQVAVEDAGGKAAKADLSGVKIKCVDQKTVLQIAQELKSRAEKIRARQDTDFERTKSMLEKLPGWLLRPVLGFVDWLSYTLNINPSFLGSPPDAFGSAMVTNVGVFGITRCYAPFFPLARAGMLIALGAIERKPVVEGDQIVIGRVLHMNGTFDHRIIDGFQGALITKEMVALLTHPERLDEPVTT
jgi:pyruvate dehydrogenase E2 component (dihydrolipoamide acetyltransferase)